MTSRALPLALALTLVACTGAPDDLTDAPSTLAVTMPVAQANKVLDLVNYPGTTRELLDTTIGLDRRAASNIAAHRDGADGRPLTADDDLFDDLAELDAVAYVGDATLERLLAYATAHPAPAPVYVAGVTFSGWEAESVLWGINRGDLAELDDAVALDARAARNLVAGAPYKSLADVGAVTYVGPATLTLLKTYAPVWWAARQGEAPLQPASYDGVTFDAATAPTALAIANLATLEQLTAHGVYSAGAYAVVGARPFASLAAVAAAPGVGTATMQAIHDYAVSGLWAPPAPEGECSVGLRGRVDADVAAVNELLRRATTLDWPFAEVIALEVNSCMTPDDAGRRDAIYEEVAYSQLINWGYSSTVYPEGEDLHRGVGSFVSYLQSAREVILERVASGAWTPTTAEDRALVKDLDGHVANLTAAAIADPARFYFTTLRIDAEECSQSAAVLFDATTMRITVVHRFPGC